jgi:hypothetical protein
MALKVFYGSVITPTITLASNATGVIRACAVIDNTSNLYMGAHAKIKYKTQTTSLDAVNGSVDLYVYSSFDNSAFSDGFAGTDEVVTTKVKTIAVVKSFPANVAATQYESEAFGVEQLFGSARLPNYYGFALKNNTGATFDTTAGNFSIIVLPWYLA